MKRNGLIVIATLLLLMSLCCGGISISIQTAFIRESFMGDIFLTDMEGIIDPPWLGYALCSGVLLILSLTVFGYYFLGTKKRHSKL